MLVSAGPAPRVRLSQMLGQLNSCNTTLPSRCRLQFSQGSQPSSSQYLNSAMNKCCLESQSSQPAPLQEEPDVLPSQLPSQMASQDFVPGCAPSATSAVLLPCRPVKRPDACLQVLAHMTELQSCHTGAFCQHPVGMHGAYLEMQWSYRLVFVGADYACPEYQC